MRSILLIVLIFVFYQIITVITHQEGDHCFNSNLNGEITGICTQLTQCSWAIAEMQHGLQVNFCEFQGEIPIVCCPSSEIGTKCSTGESSMKISCSFGEISSAKCAEFYSEEVNFIYAGKPSLVQEFPHMAILGYGSKNDIQWGCGGSLISMKHILTAAHCLNSNNLGNVKFVRLGDLDIKDDWEPADPQDFTVSKAIPHPFYDPQTSKHDIAILELNKDIVWTQYVKPACLHIGNSWEAWWPITGTGWGATEFGGEPSSHLMKVELKILGYNKCRQQYAKIGARGDIDDKVQICALSADYFRMMDTCEGDSGGPLQITNYTKEKHYTIIGITSFGKACGISRSAGIYTRVSYFIPWIESVVWGS